MGKIKTGLDNFLCFKIRYAKNIRRFLPTFLDNLYVFLRQAKPHRGPLGVVWGINNRCDARCIFCDYWRFGPKRKELSTKERLDIIKKLGKAGVRQVSFCSGEPLLSEDLGLLIQEAKKQGMLINISTNGSRLKKKAEMLIDSGVDSITISIDSHIPELHDALRGYPGLFTRIEEGIEVIRRLRRGKYPLILARCLISRKNAFALEDYVNYWSGKVDNILFKPIHKQPATFYTIPPEMKFLPEDEADFKKYYYQILNKHKRLDNLYHREIPSYLFKNDLLENKYFCFNGTFFADIDCEGNLYPCLEQGRRAGNLLREDFLGIWRSIEMRRFRKLLKGKSKCDHCWSDRFLQNLYIQKFLHLSGKN